MIIKELHLINFGKFHNKKITLHEGLNIIYGDNEAGKSTLWNFIVGMFYGFYKPYVKTRKYLDLHETYKPWTGGSYNGSILIYDEENHRELRIFRDFLQGQERVQVFIEKTGQEITDDYEIHPVFRLPDIAKKHLKISYTTFINTIALGQLRHETDENLEVELKETIINTLSTRNMDLSLTQVHRKLRESMDHIGSTRRKTSQYYLISERIRVLREEKEQGDIRLKELKALHIKEELLTQSHEIDDDTDTYKSLLNKQRKLQEDLMEYQRIEDYSYNELSLAALAYQQYYYLKDSLVQLKCRLTEYILEKDHIWEGLQPEDENQSLNTEKYGDLYIKYEKEEIHLQEEINLSEIKQKKWNRYYKASSYLFSAFSVLLLISFFVFHLLTSQDIVFYALIGVEVIGGIGFVVLWNYRNRLEQSIQREKQELEKLKQHIQALEQQNLDFQRQQLKMVNKRIEEAVEEEKEITFDMELLKEQFQEIVEFYAILSQEDFSRVLELDQKYILCVQELENVNEQIQKERDKQILIKGLNFQAQRDRLIRGHRGLAEIDEELEYETEALSQLEHEKKVNELVLETLNSITEELQHTFAPSLNQDISRLVSQLTSQRYSDIKVNPQMMMRLTDPESHQHVYAHKLSRGTLDLFYIALRYALSRWLNKNVDLPLLFDEPFAHFDDQRLILALEFFNQSGQILLFTCQKRDVIYSHSFATVQDLNT